MINTEIQTAILMTESTTESAASDPRWGLLVNKRIRAYVAGCPPLLLGKLIVKTCGWFTTGGGFNYTAVHWISHSAALERPSVHWVIACSGIPLTKSTFGLCMLHCLAPIYLLLHCCIFRMNFCSFTVAVQSVCTDWSQRFGRPLSRQSYDSIRR